MKEKHYAYKIALGTSGLNCPHSALEITGAVIHKPKKLWTNG
jgi:hypothetical protein